MCACSIVIVAVALLVMDVRSINCQANTFVNHPTGRRFDTYLKVTSYNYLKVAKINLKVTWCLSK